MTTTTLLLNTTGTLTNVVIPALGQATFTHPVVNLDLFEEFNKDEVVRDAEIISELNLAIANGFITITDTSDNSLVTDVSAANLVAYDSINGAPDATDVNNAIANSHVAVTIVDDSITAAGTDNQTLNVNIDTTTGGGDNALSLTAGEGLYVAPSAGLNDTDDLPEGVVNLYYTEARVSANTDVAANTTARHVAATPGDDSITASGTDNQTLIVNLDGTTADNQLVLTAGEGLYVPPAKFTWIWDVAIDANVNTSRRAMDRMKNMPTTDSPFYAPTASEIVRVTISNRPADVTEAWDFQIEVNDVVAYTLSLTAATNNLTDLLTVPVSLAANDKVTMFFNQNGTGAVRFPAASVYLIDQ